MEKYTTCDYCGEKCKVDNSEPNLNFCSSKCQMDYHDEEEFWEINHPEECGF